MMAMTRGWINPMKEPNIGFCSRETDYTNYKTLFITIKRLIKNIKQITVKT